MSTRQKLLHETSYLVFYFAILRLSVFHMLKDLALVWRKIRRQMIFNRSSIRVSGENKLSGNMYDGIRKLFNRTNQSIYI